MFWTENLKETLLFHPVFAIEVFFFFHWNGTVKFEDSKTTQLKEIYYIILKMI